MAELMSSFNIRAASLPELPDELWEHVFSYLKTSDLKTCVLVCRQFQEEAVRLLWSEPTFHHQITPGEFAKLSNLQLICKLSTSHIQWDSIFLEWEERPWKFERNKR